MSLRLIQFHCGRLLETLASNPQTRYHARRIKEIAETDITMLTRRAVEQTNVLWRRIKNNLNF